MKYKNADLPIDVRVNDLLTQMTIKEKVAQLSCILPNMLVGASTPDPELMKKYLQDGLGRMTQFSLIFIDRPEQIAEFANAIQKFAIEETRLGIPLLFQNEALNGFVAVKATNFPTPIALASTWEPELVERAARTIRRQMRAVGVHQALSPVLDLAQDPRWGRGHETYGEDPYLSSSFAAAFVHGLQGDDWRTGAIACAKHFLGYSISQGGVNSASIRIGERELYETFARPFETAIHESDLGSIMVTYSEINGKPVSVSPEILRELLRNKMGFKGSAICDGNSIEMTVNKQHVARDMKEAAIMAIEAGLDADTPVSQAYGELVEAVNQGQVDIRYIDEAVRRVLTQKFRLGLFEKPFVDREKVRIFYNRPEDRELSRKLAERSIILLKNEGNLLPLKGIKNIGIIGPHGDSVRSLFAAFSFPVMTEMFKHVLDGQKATMEGISDKIKEIEKEKEKSDLSLKSFNHIARLMTIPNIERFIADEFGTISLREAIENHSKEIKVAFAKGCGVTEDSKVGFDDALQIAQNAEVVIMALGGKSGWAQDATCGEAHDAVSLDLPGVQQELLEAVYATGKPIVLVLFDGRPLAINWAQEHIPAILYAWFPGQEGGEAISSVLFGDVNPGGKLPLTYPRSLGQIPIFYNHKPGSGYKKTKGEEKETVFALLTSNKSREPLYPFGYGLSYSKFEFSNLQLEPGKVDSCGKIEISCEIKNISDVAGSEVVQLYLRDCEARVTRPIQELVGFNRVYLQPSQKCRVTFGINMSQLGFWDHRMEFVVEPGNMDVMIGSSSDDIHLRGTFEITGEVINVLGNRSYLAKSEIEFFK